jgi:DNA-directed RNA polymerase subunit D
MKVLNKTPNKLVFLMEEEDWYANLLRRMILREVPTLAIEDIEFKKNDSALYDEIIGHRLGLLPLKTPLKDYTFKDKCSCEGAGCSHCQATFTIKAKGPKTIYAKDLKSSDPKVVAANPDTPIVTLAKDQRLEFSAVAILGQGKEHTKWSPGHVYYKYYPEVSINNSKLKPEVISVLPKSLFKITGNKVEVKETELVNSDLWDTFEEMTNGGITVKEDPSKIIFYLESWGQMTCKEIVENAITLCDEKLSDFGKLLK